MNTQEKFVITISREVGTGGRTIGRKLAERLNVRYCDKDLIQQLIGKFGLSSTEIERIKGQKKNWLQDLMIKFYTSPEPDLSFKNTQAGIQGVTSDEIFACEKEVIASLAQEESCVIAGRSAFFILKDQPNVLNIFIRASRENRIARIMQRQGLSEAEAAEVLEKVDKARENFVKRYGGSSRYDLRSYDLVLNVDGLSEDKAVELILDYIG